MVYPARPTRSGETLRDYREEIEIEIRKESKQHHSNNSNNSNNNDDDHAHLLAVPMVLDLAQDIIFGVD